MSLSAAGEGLRFMAQGRGIRKGFRRAVYIGKRFGLSPRRHLECLRLYWDLLKRHRVRGTFFIPATILETYWKDIRLLDTEAVEWGIHGHWHTDLSRLGIEAQRDQLRAAVNVFDGLRIPFAG